MRVEDAKEQTYTMKISRTLPVAAILALLTGAARADVKITQATTIDNPQLAAAMQSMSPEQKAQMAKMGMGGTILSTTYISGGKSRTDVGDANSVIVNKGSGQVTTLNRIAHTYSTQSYAAVYGRKQQGVTASVTPTGKTKTILGHSCRDYRLTMTSPALQGGQISGDLWAATDLPRPPIPTMAGGAGAALSGQWSKISGMPLVMTLVVSGSPAGKTTVTSRATAISTTPIPASAFAVPAGYKPGPAYASPMMGGMNP